MYNYRKKQMNGSENRGYMPNTGNGANMVKSVAGSSGYSSPIGSPVIRDCSVGGEVSHPKMAFNSGMKMDYSANRGSRIFS